MVKILARYQANVWFRYEGGEIHAGAKSFELNMGDLEDWSATLECFCAEDDGKRVADFLSLTGQLELSICPGCSFKGEAIVESANFKAAVDSIITRVFIFKGTDRLEPPIVE